MNFVFLFAYIVEATVLEIFARRLYQPRLKWWLRVLTYCTLYGVLLLVHSPYHVYRNIILDIFAGFIVFCGIYNATIPIGIFNALILVSANFISELFFSNLISHYNNNYWEVWKTAGNYILLFTSRSFFFIISLLIAKLQKLDSKSTIRSIPENIVSTGIVICTMALLCILSSIIYTIPYSPKTETLFYIALVILFLSFTLILLWYHFMQKRYSEYAKLQLQLQRSMDGTSYYSYMEQKDSELRILVHDIKNHLQSISALNNNAESELYVEKLMTCITEATPAIISKNEFINAIINRYRLLAKERNISFSHDIRNINLDFIDKMDLTSILCNLLDNAFDGCKTVKSFIDLSIYYDTQTCATLFTVVNSCEKAPRKNRLGQFISAKDNSDLHGLGIRSITNAASKYNGDTNFYYKPEDSTFHAIVMLHEELI